MQDDGSENQNLFMIRCFRPRLIKSIQVISILDYLHSIDIDVRTKIKAVAQNHGDPEATRMLLDHIEKGPRETGWFAEFVNALETECSQAALYVAAENIPSPSMEAKNDECELLIRLLCPELVKKLEPDETCKICREKKICTDEDVEVITAMCQQKGLICASRELLVRITKKKNWFPKFIEVLNEMGYQELATSLSGGSLDESTEVNESAEPEDIDKSKLSNGQLKQETGICDGDVSVNSNESQNPENSIKTLEISYEENSAPSDLDSSIANLSLNQSCESNGKGNESDHDMDRASPVNNISLRSYQMEVAKPALEGKNIIICLPTGSGKTRVAVYIAREHLDKRNELGLPAKVIVLVNKVPLVDQHYRREFNPYLKDRYKIDKISGESALKVSFHPVVKKNDVIICTAQILENSLIQAAEDEQEGVKLSDFSLIIIDECHHTQKDAVYNNIMIRYVKMKKKNLQRKKINKPLLAVPQILGLTASPGVGGAKNSKKAEEHILKICANLDADNIMIVQENIDQLREHVKEPCKRVEIAEDKKRNPFGDKINEMMEEIQNYGALFPKSDFGTQSFEQWVVQKEKSAAKEGNRKEHVCAEHLKKYNDALIINDTIRMTDAFNHLTKFYSEEKAKQARLSEENEGASAVHMDETDDFLIKLFYKHTKELKRISKQPEYENEKLIILRESIMMEFTRKYNARGIIFTKTRQSAVALHEWIDGNEKFREVGVRPHYLIGAGSNSDFKAMTPNEQREVLNKFSTGSINLLLATTVAEEGLDIKECNFVINYGQVTNEISMVQARGRARDEDSSFVLIASNSSGAVEHDTVNERREQMMYKAIQKVKSMTRKEYLDKIQEYQCQNIIEKRAKNKKKMVKDIKYDPSVVTFHCMKCSLKAFSGIDIYVIENMHHVNTTESFKELYGKGENKSLHAKHANYQTNREIFCKSCSRPWGTMMVHKGYDLPCVRILNFVVKYKANKMTPETFEQWRDVPIKFPEFKCAEVELSTDESDED
uniref:RNA helicase n=1 Tax=Leptobrachium leishanense TaxID=445787 RepID=A0A8C5R5K7_9ANUR